MNASSTFDIELRSTLVRCIRESAVVEETTATINQERIVSKVETFDPRLFFQYWFRRDGQAWFFLFKKNQKITNIQFAELLALIRSHARRAGQSVRDVQFVSVKEFNTSVENIIGSFTTHDKDWSSLADDVGTLFLDLLKDLVVVDPYFGSCSVFLPPGMEIDHIQVCGFSGYIHSCGKSLLVRNISKATKHELSSMLTELVRTHPAEGRVHLLVYGHEDFTPDDRHQAEYLKDGLDDVKVYVEKYYIGSEPLVKILKEITQSPPLANRVVIPPPRKARHRKKGPSEQGYYSNTVSPLPQNDIVVWLIVDHGIGSSIGQRGREKYFICYQQIGKNENPFHLFDENKPAWIDHTTIPHTLMGAMINITRPWWPKPPAAVMIGDPFVGTGTTWLEALKYGVNLECGDKSPFSPMLVEDNIRFFCLTADQLKTIIEQLRAAADIEPNALLAAASRFGADHEQELHCHYRWALQIYLRLCPENTARDFSLNNATIEEIRNQQNLVAKLLLYLTLRTHRRHLVAFSRGSELWRDAFEKETDGLCLQIKELV